MALGAAAPRVALPSTVPTQHKDAMRITATISLSHSPSEVSLRSKPWQASPPQLGFPFETGFWSTTQKPIRKNKQNHRPSSVRQSSLLEATKHKQSSLGTQGLPPSWQKHKACAVLWRPCHTAQCLQPPSCHGPGIPLSALTEGTGFRTQCWHLSLGLETLPGGKAAPLPWGQPCLQPS